MRGLDEKHPLLDAVDRDNLRRHFDAHRLTQHVGREPCDILRHGRGKQERLPLPRQPGDDLAHIMDETHVEHAVGFVQHEMLHIVQPRMALLDKVEKPPRRGDENVDAAGQRLDLASLSDAAENDGVTQAQMPAVGGKAFADLDRELARRRKDERAHRAWRGRLRLAELLQNGQREGGRLAGAGLGDAEQIAPFKEKRNGAGLDGCGICMVFRDERAADRLAKSELGK